MAELSPPIRKLRDQLAPLVLDGLLRTQAQHDEGRPIRPEHRARLDEEIAYWSQPDGN